MKDESGYTKPKGLWWVVFRAYIRLLNGEEIPLELEQIQEKMTALPEGSKALLLLQQVVSQEDRQQALEEAVDWTLEHLKSIGFSTVLSDVTEIMALLARDNFVPDKMEEVNEILTSVVLQIDLNRAEGQLLANLIGMYDSRQLDAAYQAGMELLKKLSEGLYDNLYHMPDGFKE